MKKREPMRNEKKKVLILLRKGGRNGGPYVSHMRIANSRLKEEYDFEIYETLRARDYINPFGMYRFVRDLKRINPDVVHVAGLQLEGFFSVLACVLAHKKIVLAVHGSCLEIQDLSFVSKKIFSFIEKFSVKNADIVYGVSDYVGTWEVLKNCKNYFGTIYNISLNNQNCNSEENFKEELNIGENDIVISSTGRVVKEKGYDILWEVIKQVGKKENVKYVIAGDGDYRSQWEKEIIENGYEKNVFLLGYRENIDEILAQSDVFIMCTRHETLCISLLEAAMNRLPLVASKVGGIPEIITDGTSGFLVENGNVNSFVNALEKLIEDKEMRKKMGKNAFDYVTEKFNEEDILNKIERLYNMLLIEDV